MQSRHSKLYCLYSRDIQNFIVCAIATFKTLLFVQSRHSKLYCLCNRDIQNFIVCAIETFKTLLFVQSRHSKLYCLCSRAIRNFLVCVSLLGLRNLVFHGPRLFLAGVLSSSWGGSHVRITNTLSLLVSGEGLGRSVQGASVRKTTWSLCNG